MPAFDLVVLGCGGGPNESNLSSYLLKPHDALWSDGIVALEAGSGIGALLQLLKTEPDLFGVRQDGKGHSAAEVFSWIRCYLITHAHLDHVNGVVLGAGAFPGPPRKIHATHQTLKDIESLFSDRIWPNLTSWEEENLPPYVSLIYSVLTPDGQYKPISKDISVHTMPLSHGRYPSCVLTMYDSAAFFVRHDPSGQEFLFFGDLEPDSIAGGGRTQAVWDTAAPLIPSRLSTIFIECSWPMGRPDDMLYGHLNPEHLIEELANLAASVWKTRNSNADREDTTSPSSDATSTNTPHRVRKRQKRNHKSFSHPSPPSADQLRGVLDGVRVVIIHCKDDLTGEYDRPVNLVIADQIRGLVEERGFGAEVVAAAQGMHISI
ncbi:cAMP phosphodiesterases class-II-domain-containing protein [Cristinia sonorae]|uniref:cAMP phosphodiesterases class-II-domain-containing protein n=1 Tax=Cristinia sonorae TaxID=1940300 RepID=A0A8K0USG6_9AGAR|nr:cAMP phosphodiesterases class-II-domain-containing protein [Cristinia sonorae]